MLVQHIKVKSVNVHQSNERIHTLLNLDDTDILLIQEPWYSTIATLRSDTDPLGTPSRGAPINNKWDLHVPKTRNAKTCKTIAYTRKSLSYTHATVKTTNVLNHLLSTQNSIILDIKEDDHTSLRIINFYHMVLKNGGHNLQPLLDYNMDDSTPTLLIGDFNTHSRRWSLPDKKESSWAPRLLDWLNTNLLSLLNPPRIPTWHGYKESDKPSVLDLAFANNGALIDGQLREIVVSRADSLSSDHAALLTSFTPSTHIALLPPPAPKGYKIEEEQWEA